MPSFSRPKGTRDLDADLAGRFEAVREVFLDLSWNMGYTLVDTPILEQHDLFARAAGEGSEVVQKQMYSLEDGGGRHLALRPEGTPGLIRAAVENGWLGARNGDRFAYCGPMFRYERPQKGRYRQFWQLGVEFLGAAGPEADAESIILLAGLMEELGIRHTMKVNTLGTPEERAAYTAALGVWLTEREGELAAQDRANIGGNTLRILDSKRPETREAVKGAPRLVDTVGAEGRRRFKSVLALLQAAKVAHEVDHLLVRGLDYYGHTVFEAVGHEGAQDAYGGGGRYDGLVAALGGPEMPGVGFAAGMDRLAAAADVGSEAAPVWLVGLGEEGRAAAWLLAVKLWEVGLQCQVAWNEKNLRKALGRAAAAEASHVLIVGAEEATAGTVVVRDMESGEQETVPADPGPIGNLTTPEGGV